MKYINNLLSFGIKPIMVFDGCRLPSKREVEKARREYVYRAVCWQIIIILHFVETAAVVKVLLQLLLRVGILTVSHTIGHMHKLAKI